MDHLVVRMAVIGVRLIDNVDPIGMTSLFWVN